MKKTGSSIIYGMRRWNITKNALDICIDWSMLSANDLFVVEATLRCLLKKLNEKPKRYMYILYFTIKPLTEFCPHILEVFTILPETSVCKCISKVYDKVG